MDSIGVDAEQLRMFQTILVQSCGPSHLLGAPTVGQMFLFALNQTLEVIMCRLFAVSLSPMDITRMG